MTSSADGRLFRITAITGIGLAIAGALARASEGHGPAGWRNAAIVAAVFVVLWAIHAAVRTVSGAAVAVLALGAVALVSPMIADTVAVGVVLWAVSQDRDALRLPRRSMTWLVDLGAAAAAAVAIASAHHYADFLISERLPVELLNRDTLFHASIASMIKNYGVVSTGIDGLVYTPYHAASHAFFGALSAMTRLPVLEVYGTLYLAVVCPLLVFAMAHYASRVLHTPGDGLGAWLVAAVALSAWTCVPLFADAGVYDNFFVSESYAFSLIVLLAAFARLAVANRSTTDYVIAAVLIVVAAAAKGSVGVIAIAMLLTTAVVDLWRWRTWPHLAVCAIATVLVLASLRAVAQMGLTFMTWKPLAFMVVNSGWPDEMTRLAAALAGAGGVVIGKRAPALLLVFLILHFMSATLQLLSTAARRDTAVFDRVVMTLWGAAAAGIGVLAVLTLDIPGSGVLYFSTVSLFVSFPAVVVAVRAVSTPFPGAELRAYVGVTLALVCVSVTGARWKPEVIARKFGHAQLIGDGRAVLAQQAGNTVNRELGPVIRQLESLRQTRGEQDAAMFGATIRTPNEAMYGCYYTPFLLPAVSEQPWRHAINPSVCTYPSTYLYYWYFRK